MSQDDLTVQEQEIRLKMYIYDRRFPGSLYRCKEQPIASRIAQRDSFYADQVGSKVGIRNGSIGAYVWVNEGLGILSSGTSLQPQISAFRLPQEAGKIPKDQSLRAELGKIKTNEARALSRAFLTFGKPKQFEASLLTALRTIPLPGKGLKRYEIYLARLGAEAFVLGISVGGDKIAHVGFVDHPAHLSASLTSSYRDYFLHFAIRRLLSSSSTTSTLEAHRNVFLRSIAIFTALQAELAREYRLVGIAETILADYRRLMVAIIWKHYQILMDLLLAKARKSKTVLADVLKELDDLFRKASITRVQDARAIAPCFHTGSGEYRDYFTPSNRTDIKFTYFSRIARPQTENEPTISFRTVVRRRGEQIRLLGELQKMSQPDLPPKLHDSASWQVWVRQMWDGKLSSVPPDKRLAKILMVVEQYFEAFTAHVPHDLIEGCSEQNYLTRSFPRAITGSQVHDCAVYAIRWIHILGRLLNPRSLPAGIQDPRIYLIEMPGHVGVMIRVKRAVGDDILVSINNKSAKMHAVDRTETDKGAAEMVVQDQYQGMKTPFVFRRISASPSDAKALWREVCRIFDRKLRLPYSDKSEPHLRYLAYNAGVAIVGRQLADTVARLWLEFRQRLAKMKSKNRSVPANWVEAELKQYRQAVEKAVKAATDKYKQDVAPLISKINNDILANQRRLPREAIILETSPTLKPWESAWIKYRPKLDEAVKSRIITEINPEVFFPEDDFVAAIQ